MDAEFFDGRRDNACAYADIRTIRVYSSHKLADRTQRPEG